MSSSEALSTHVVPADQGWLKAVAAGLFCTVCREQFRSFLWPHEQMLIQCDCPCICHRHAADRDVDGHLLPEMTSQQLASAFKVYFKPPNGDVEPMDGYVFE